jgi:hypothetical protein
MPRERRRSPVLAAGGLILGLLMATGAAGQAISPTEMRAIVKDAYIYGFPLVDSYRIQYAFFVDHDNSQFKGAWNEVHNTARVFTPKDTAVQTPNSDTPYSHLGADLRAEPLVLSVPEVEKGRYYSVQFVDMYTFNFAYVGSRATGNGVGNFLLAGPRWQGVKPDGIEQVIRSDTDLDFVQYRTQLFSPNDIDNVKKVQAGYKVQTLSQFLGKQTPLPAPAINFVKPLSPEDERTSPEFFNILNFVLQFCPTDPSETALMERFAKVNVGAGKTFDPKSLPPEMQKAVQDGMADAWQALGALKKTEIDTGKISSADAFGTRAFLSKVAGKNMYLFRMAAAVFGIYGNSKAEAIYPVYFVDSAGQKLDGAHRYTLRLEPGQMPPVNAFWSLTMYELPAILLYANPINRYLINSPMLPSLKRDADGGITLNVQNDSPGVEKEPNWLPAPKGPFVVFLRLYWPKPEALDGKWKQPPLRRID